MKSKIYSSDLVKASSKGQFWIPCFLMIGFLFAFPVAELVMLGNWTGQEYTPDQIAFLYENLWKDGFVVTGMAVTAGAAIINGINGFWYLYSSGKIDLYHSLPVKRSGLFWHRVYTGLLYDLIPYVTMMFFSICIGAMRGFFSLSLMGLALKMLLFHLEVYFLLYFVTILVITVTGNILTGILVMIGVCLYGKILGLLMEGYRHMFFSTDYDIRAWGVPKILEEYGTSFGFLETMGNKYIEGSCMAAMGTVFLAAALVGMIAWISYEKRPAEKAGKPVIYGWLEVVLRFLVVVPGGLGTGLIFYLLPADTSGTVIWWIFGMIFGTVLFHGVMEVIYQMDFRKFFSRRLQLILAGLLVAVCAVIYQKDLVGFDAYLPPREKLAGICLEPWSLYGEYGDLICAGEDGSFESVQWDSSEMDLTGEHGVGEAAYEALQEIVKTQTKGDSESLEWKYSVSVKYLLTSGKAVYRNYLLSAGQMQKVISALMEEGTMREKRYSFLQIPDQFLKQVNGSFANGQGFTLFQNQRDKQAALLEAFREDVEEADTEAFLEQPYVKLNFQFETPCFSINQMVPGEYGTMVYYGVVFVYPSFKRTLAILEETGYPLTMEEWEPDSITVQYYNSSGMDEEKIVYDRPEEMDALKQALVPGDMSCGCVEYAAGLEVSYSFENDWNSSWGQLIEEKLPDFVREERDKME